MGGLVSVAMSTFARFVYFLYRDVGVRQEHPPRGFSVQEGNDAVRERKNSPLNYDPVSLILNVQIQRIVRLISNNYSSHVALRAAKSPGMAQSADEFY